MDWNREVLGVPLKYALPIVGGVLVAAVVFFLWRRSQSSGGTVQAKPTASTLSASGAQLAAAGVAPYYGGVGGGSTAVNAIQVPSPVWQYGNPPATGYVWKPTGVNGPQGVDPNNVMPGSGGDPVKLGLPDFGNYSWQWSKVPQGWTDSQYAQALSAALRSGGLTSPNVEQATLSGYGPEAGVSYPNVNLPGAVSGTVPAVPAG